MQGVGGSSPLSPTSLLDRKNLKNANVFEVFCFSGGWFCGVGITCNKLCCLGKFPQTTPQTECGQERKKIVFLEQIYQLPAK
jgi:hypothetical protein